MTVSIQNAQQLAATLTTANTATLTKNYPAFTAAKQAAAELGMTLPQGMFVRNRPISSNLIQEMRTTTEQVLLEDILKDISYDSLMY